MIMMVVAPLVIISIRIRLVFPPRRRSRAAPARARIWVAIPAMTIPGLTAQHATAKNGKEETEEDIFEAGAHNLVLSLTLLLLRTPCHFIRYSNRCFLHQFGELRYNFG